MGRRGEDVERCGEVERKAWREAEMKTGVEKDRDAEWVVPHPHVVHKNQKEYLGSKGSQPQTRHPAQGSSARKISPHYFWL